MRSTSLLIAVQECWLHLCWRWRVALTKWRVHSLVSNASLSVVLVCFRCFLLLSCCCCVIESPLLTKAGGANKVKSAFASTYCKHLFYVRGFDRYVVEASFLRSGIWSLRVRTASICFTFGDWSLRFFFITHYFHINPSKLSDFINNTVRALLLFVERHAHALTLHALLHVIGASKFIITHHSHFNLTLFHISYMTFFPLQCVLCYCWLKGMHTHRRCTVC
jgi:hypothetical protein